VVARMIFLCADARHHLVGGLAPGPRRLGNRRLSVGQQGRRPDRAKPDSWDVAVGRARRARVEIRRSGPLAAMRRRRVHGRHPMARHCLCSRGYSSRRPGTPCDQPIRSARARPRRAPWSNGFHVVRAALALQIIDSNAAASSSMERPGRAGKRVAPRPGSRRRSARF